MKSGFGGFCKAGRKAGLKDVNTWRSGKLTTQLEALIELRSLPEINLPVVSNVCNSELSTFSCSRGPIHPGAFACALC